MTRSVRAIIILSLLPFILLAVLRPVFWEMFQGQGVSLVVFGGFFYTVYFGLTTLYFMMMWLWDVSLEKEEK